MNVSSFGVSSFIVMLYFVVLQKACHYDGNNSSIPLELIALYNDVTHDETCHLDKSLVLHHKWSLSHINYQTQGNI